MAEDKMPTAGADPFGEQIGVWDHGQTDESVHAARKAPSYRRAWAARNDQITSLALMFYKEMPFSRRANVSFSALDNGEAPSDGRLRGFHTRRHRHVRGSPRTIVDRPTCRP